ncbi:MAG: DUF6118 family protein [Sphingobium sp.]|uniref:Uncharacterized protein n=2 Tax=Sphingomonadales TaxID=204457 RepID=A0A0A7PPL5_9SPHN|nr:MULTISPECIES: DUF6118 family protein [Sphingomonadaceae]AJA11158.1 hypothetical protein SKP52_21475 [Sphingopyxis fribergensis]OHT22301.1 hypothetical protein BHE75_04328 [Sphingomonas haloaromaticamans]
MDDEQSLLNKPELQKESAGQAFARLDRRIAMMAHAVEHLAAERASIDIPDYSATLGQMNTRLAAVAQGLAVIAEKPAMQLTPEGLAARMDAAAEKSRAADKATLREAREGHQEAARIIHGFVEAVRVTGEQRRCLIWAGGGGLAAGCLLWSILPGVVLRALPTSWHMPESMAAHIIGEPTLWDAGTRMMRASDPDAWTAITTAAKMLHDNRDAIAACEQAVAKAAQPVRCTIKVGR